MTRHDIKIKFSKLQKLELRNVEAADMGRFFDCLWTGQDFQLDEITLHSNWHEKVEDVIVVPADFYDF